MIQSNLILPAAKLQSINSIQTPLSIESPAKEKKKHLKKQSTKIKGTKSKKQKNISPNGKTLSTESCSSGIGRIQSQAVIDEANSHKKSPDKLKKARRSSKKDSELNLEKQAKESLKLLEHKSNHLSLLGKRFRIEDELLGFGSFGRTYLGQDLKHNKEVAIKIMLKRKSMDSFLREATVLKSVNFMKASGFPQMLMSAYNEDICILVEELLGTNLESLRKKYGRLSQATICSIGIQLVRHLSVRQHQIQINRLESLHNCGFIHRDIKPQNILLGPNSNEKQNKVYLIDFGLSIQYLDENSMHYKPQANAYSTVVGTALFASINAHQGKDQSRRDDLESLIYTLLYLSTGSLPWKNINIKKKKQRHQLIMYLKEEIGMNNQIFMNDQVPVEIFQMLQYTQALQFDEEPDYSYLKQLLQKILKRNYSGIKKITDIDILHNNHEDSRKSSSNQVIQDQNNQNQAMANDLGIIDVSQIAFNIGMGFDGNDGLQSIASNEQLVFRSELDGKTNNMNTNDLKDEIQMKLNPSMFRSLFNDQPQDCQNNGRLISEIPEEPEESDSYGEDGGSEDDNEESKENSNQSKINEEIEEEQEDDVDDDSDMIVGDEDIPDDLEVCAQIQGYFLKANDFHLTDKKGNNIQQLR